MSITTFISSFVKSSINMYMYYIHKISSISVLYWKTVLFGFLKSLFTTTLISVGILLASVTSLAIVNSIFGFGINLIAMVLYSLVFLLCISIAMSQSFYYLLTIGIISGAGACMMILISETFESVTGTPSPMSPTRSSRRDNTAANIIFCLIAIYALTGLCLYKETNRLSQLTFEAPAEVIKDEISKKKTTKPLYELKVFDTQKPIIAKQKPKSAKKVTMTPKRRAVMHRIAANRGE